MNNDRSGSRRLWDDVMAVTKNRDTTVEFFGSLRCLGSFHLKHKPNEQWTHDDYHTVAVDGTEALSTLTDMYPKVVAALKEIDVGELKDADAWGRIETLLSSAAHSPKKCWFSTTGTGNAYRERYRPFKTMTSGIPLEGDKWTVLTGESGSGKTEAILQCAMSDDKVQPYVVASYLLGAELGSTRDDDRPSRWDFTPIFPKLEEEKLALLGNNVSDTERKTCRNQAAVEGLIHHLEKYILNTALPILHRVSDNTPLKWTLLIAIDEVGRYQWMVRGLLSESQEKVGAQILAKLGLPPSKWTVRLMLAGTGAEDTAPGSHKDLVDLRDFSVDRNVI